MKILEKGRARLWWDEQNKYVVEIFSGEHQDYRHVGESYERAVEAFEKLAEE